MKLATLSAIVAMPSVHLFNIQPPVSGSSILLTYVLVVAVYLTWKIVLAPYFSPFTDLPSPEQGPWYKRFLKEPDPGDLERWINEIPNNGELNDATTTALAC